MEINIGGIGIAAHLMHGIIPVILGTTTDTDTVHGIIGAAITDITAVTIRTILIMETATEIIMRITPNPEIHIPD